MKGLFLCALLAIGILSEAADAGRLFRAGRRAPIAGAHAADDTLAGLRGFGASDDAIAGLAQWERRNLDDATLEFALQAPARTDGFRRLEQVARQARAEGFSGRTAALNADSPWFRIRLARTAALDRDILRFAQTRLEKSLALPFDVRKLRVVTLGLSDDAARSASEALRLQRGLPPAVRDQFGPLARIAEAGATTHRERVKWLAPYSGKTVVVVGHIPEARGSFFVFAPDGSRVPVDMRAWMSAASEARVNLIPVGCKSARLTPIGVHGLVNSENVRRRLNRVIAGQPRTIGNFLKSFSGRDMILVADPFDVTLFSSGLTFMDSLARTDLAYLALRAASNSRDTVPRVNAEAAFDRCFAARNAGDFAVCEQRVRGGFARLDAQVREREFESYRRDRLAHVTAAIPSLEGEIAAQLDSWRRHAFFFVFAVLLFTLAVVHAHLGARGVEEDEGASWAALGGRTSIRRTAQAFTRGKESGERELEIMILLVVMLAGGVIALLAGELSTNGLWFAVFLGAGIGGVFKYLGVAISNGRAWPLLAALGILASALAAGGIAERGKALAIKKQDLRYRFIERGDLLITAGPTQWRQTADYSVDSRRDESVALPSEMPPT